jgi:hypothetical protein
LTTRTPLALLACFVALLGLSRPAEATTVNIVGTTITGPSNCIPFGGYSNAYMGFVYKNVPAFTLGIGDTVSFDLGALNDVAINMDVAMATTTANGSMQQNATGFTTVATNAFPSARNGDSIIGNYELTYTADTAFVFAGGGLIIRLKPRGTMASDTNCTQVLMHADSTDASGLFVGRFYTDPDGVYPWTGTDTVHIGVVRIVTGSTPWYADTDGDGYGNSASVTYAVTAPAGYVSNSTDCDDTRSSVHPAAAETCNSIDDDCDGVVDDGAGSAWYLDDDGDSFGGTTTVVIACTAPSGYISTSTDCDDTLASVYPGAPEYCNGVDDDCDTDIDDGAVDASAWYADVDGDSYGDATDTTVDCDTPTGYVSDDTDCDDSSAAVHPGAGEYCDGVDDDCDGFVDESALDASTWYADGDGDTYGNAGATFVDCSAPAGYLADSTDCDDTRASVHPGATETCNSIDDDCDGTVDDGATDAVTWYADADGDTYGNSAATAVDCSAPSGYLADATDCDDTSATVHPGATESCNGVDDDCDGTVDDSAIDASTWYADADGDSFGDATVIALDCALPTGYSGDDRDCDDTDAAVNPDALEICNTIDDDCDGTVDLGADDASTWYTDADGDTWGDPATAVDACTAPSGTLADDTDCDDTSATVHPTADEHCNGIDDDCDGTVDEDAVDVGSWHADADADGYGDPAVTSVECTAPVGYLADATDCNDADATVHPGAGEYCNGVDDDCDGTIDLGALDAATWYADADGDTFGDAAATAAACAAPTGYGTDATDCDDTDATVYPGAADIPYDGLDQDCDGADLTDADLDGWTARVVGGDDCDDGDAAVFPGAPESADGIDANCDGVVDEGTAWYDDDGDGYTEDGGDCDDADGDIHPSSPETADGVDEDCDGVVDDGTSSVDDDGDGVTEDGGDCNDGDPRQSPDNAEIGGNGIDDDCDGAVDSGVYDPDADGYTALGGDCAEDDAAIHPGADEIADGIDNDCDGAIDEGTTDIDNDGDGYTEAEGDCDDQDASIGLGAEDIVDGVDNDCDGDVDEGTDAFDDDGDGYTEEGGDCDDADPALNPAAEDVLNGIDDDCDGIVDAGVLDVDHDGYTVDSGDCDDSTGWANPGMAEVCDGIDNNCDGVTDEDCTMDEEPAPRVKTCGCASARTGEGGTSLVGLGVGLLAIVGLRRSAPRRPRLGGFGSLADLGALARLGGGLLALLGLGAGCGDSQYGISDKVKKLVVSPGLVDLGDLTLGEEADYTIDLTTTSGTDVKVVAVDLLTVAGDGFSDTEDAFPTVALDETATLHFHYAGVAEGWNRAQITIQTDETKESSHVVDVRVHTGVPAAALRPRLLDFGPVAIGDTGFGSFTLENTGPLAIEVASMTFDNPVYTAGIALPVTVPVASEVDLDVVFTPVDLLPALGTLTVGLGGGAIVPYGYLRGNDCVDGSADLYDVDGDGFSGCGPDCDDADPDVRPGVVEICDEIDQDCDGVVDEGTTCGDDDVDGYTEDGGDCNDADPTINPAADEVAGNGRDDDCDGVVDQGTEDNDYDGSGTLGGDCDDTDATVYTGAPELEDGLDNDCDGAIDEGTPGVDDDGDGVSEDAGDCDDGDSASYPGAAEVADWRDNDCDGTVDEGTRSADDDADGYTEVGGDCDDADATVSPAMTEILANGVDDDCNGVIDG